MIQRHSTSERCARHGSEATAKSRRINAVVKRRKIAESRQGFAVVELAICIIPLFIIIFGTVEICQQLHRRQDAIVVAFEGARMRSIKNSTTAESDRICRAMLSDRNIQGGNVVFRFPNGDQAGAVFEVQVDVPAQQIQLPYSLFGDRIFVTRYGMIE